MNIELSKATQDGVVRRHTVQLYRHPLTKTEETRRARVVRVVAIEVCRHTTACGA